VKGKNQFSSGQAEKAAEKDERNDKKEGTSDWVETWGRFRQAYVGSW